MYRKVLLSPRTFRSLQSLHASCFLSARASDSLLGQSPMAPSSLAGTTGETGKITAQDVTTSGGVWAPTSAKRDKLNELRAALGEGEASLDDAAKEEEKLDLFLADGIAAVVKAAERRAPEDSTLKTFLDWLETSSRHDFPDDLAQVQFENYLTTISSRVDSTFQSIPRDRYLKSIRDFMEVPTENLEIVEKFLAVNNSDDTFAAFHACILRYRLHLVKAAAEHLKNNWDKLVTVTSGDMDRAAVKGESVEPKASTLPREAVKNVLLEFAKGNCFSRVDAIWTLVDRDQDGLLDQTEMNVVAYLSVTPVGKALQQLFDEAVDSRPVRQPLFGDAEDNNKKGFFARRAEASIARKLKTQLARAVKQHFEDEVEMPHRLRCIYAWAQKSHQDNKIDSVHIDTGLGGRKRYVELEPKVSLAEFREVQQEHFTHLDRVGEEMVKSFREDLWVIQGKKREGVELRRNVAYFMATICTIDVIIYYL